MGVLLSLGDGGLFLLLPSPSSRRGLDGETTSVLQNPLVRGFLSHESFGVLSY